MKALLAIVLIALVTISGLMFIWGDINLESSQVFCTIAIGVSVIACLIKLFSGNNDSDE